MYSDLSWRSPYTEGHLTSLPLCLFSDHFSIHPLVNDMNMNESCYHHNQPQQLRCSDRTAVKTGPPQSFSWAQTSAFGANQDAIYSNSSACMVTNRWVATPLVSYPPLYVIFKRWKPAALTLITANIQRGACQEGFLWYLTATRASPTRHTPLNTHDVSHTRLNPSSYYIEYVLLM